MGRGVIETIHSKTLKLLMFISREKQLYSISCKIEYLFYNERDLFNQLINLIPIEKSFWIGFFEFV